MNGSVVFSNDAPPPSLANATSSTATRPSSFDAGRQRARRQEREPRQRGGRGRRHGAQDYSTLVAGAWHRRSPPRPACYDWDVELNDAVEAILRDLDRRWGVDAAWLFGSQVRGARADSDIDLAILFRDRPDGAKLLDARADLEQLVGRPVDVVDLDAASPIIAHQAIKTGRLVADHVPRRRIAFLTHLPDRYEDLTLVRKTIEETILRRIAHGRT